MEALARSVLVAAIAWGAFAFGAVYPWGYGPLAAAAACLGLAGLAIVRRLPRGSFPTALSAALAAVALACGLQLVPLPTPAVARVSPEAPTIQAQYLPGAVALTSRPLSISPPQTTRALWIFIPLAALTVGAACLFTATGTTRVCTAIAVIGVLLALSGMVQKSVESTKPLGFWTTLDGGNPYGPFVNRNHFAGWMLMAIPLSLGLLCAKVSRQTRGTRATVRERILWFATAEASQAVLLAAGTAIMILSVFLTQSRSGMMAAAAAVAMTAALVWRRQSGARRLALVGMFAVVLIGVTAWVGVGQIVERFGEGAAHDYTGRLGPWMDAWRVSRLYPLTGTGINTYGVAMLFYQQFATDVHFSAAHNDYLQVLAEGGVLVGLPVLAALAALVVTIARRAREETSQSTFWIRAGAAIGLLSIGLQELGDFSLQIPGNAFLFAVVCAIAIHKTPERQRA